MIYFTADLHLNHNNIISYCKRPFANISHMNSEIFLMFSQLKIGDVIYILGDIGYDSKITEVLLRGLKNKGIIIYFIRGNHDNSKIIDVIKKYCIYLGDMKTIIVEQQEIVITHYAMHEWNNSHFNSWNLHGHSHGLHTPIGKQYDVGVDKNSFALVPFGKIKTLMEKLTNNINYLGKCENQKI